MQINSFLSRIFLFPCGIVWYSYPGWSRSTPPSSHRCTCPQQGMKCVRGQHTVERVLPPTVKTVSRHAKVRISNQEKTPCAPCAGARVCSSSYMDTRTSALPHNYSTSVIPNMHQSTPEIADTICMFTNPLQISTTASHDYNHPSLVLPALHFPPTAHAPAGKQEVASVLFASACSGRKKK